MINLKIKSKDSSTELQTALNNMGLFVTHYNAELHVDGTEEQIAEGEAFLLTYDLSGGVFKDVAKIFEKAVQKHLDTQAQAEGYDNIISASSYAGTTNAFQAESKRFLNWRSAVWEYSYAQLAEVTTGNRTRPAAAEFILELPKLVS